MLLNFEFSPYTNDTLLHISHITYYLAKIEEKILLD